VKVERATAWLAVFATILAGAAVLWLAWHVLRAVGPAVAVAAAGGILATLLAPLAERAQAMVRSRALAALAVILLVMVPFAILAGAVLTLVLHQAQGLLRQMPAILASATGFLASLQAYLQIHFHIHLDLTSSLSLPKGAGAAALPSTLTQSLANAGGGLLRESIGLLSGLVTVTVDTVLALVVAFFLLLDGRAMARALFELLPSSWQGGAHAFADILSSVVTAYFRGQVIVGAIFGLMIGVGMFALGLPDAVLLGFLAAVFEMIPTIGPILASAAPILLSLTLPAPHLVWVLLVLVAAQQIESNLLVPRISGGIVGLHPLTVILAVFAGFGVGGLGGALLAVPVVAILRESIRRWWRPPEAPALVAVPPTWHLPRMHRPPPRERSRPKA
jgi:predicted PurR-regulated permease PerM